MSLLLGSRLATVATRCDKHDPVARQPELLWQSESCAEGATLKRSRPTEHWSQTIMKRKIIDKNAKKNMKVCGQLWTAIKKGLTFQPECVVTRIVVSVSLLLYRPGNPACQQSFDLWGGMLCKACSWYTVCKHTHKRAQCMAGGSQGLLYKTLLRLWTYRLSLSHCLHTCST